MLYRSLHYHTEFRYLENGLIGRTEKEHALLEYKAGAPDKTFGYALMEDVLVRAIAVAPDEGQGPDSAACRGLIRVEDRYRAKRVSEEEDASIG